MAWFNYPLWALTVYMKMLSPLQAEQQLHRIESASVPHMKQDAVAKLVGRLQRRAHRERPKSTSEQLMGAMKVVHEPAPRKG